MNHEYRNSLLLLAGLLGLLATSLGCVLYGIFTTDIQDASIRDALKVVGTLVSVLAIVMLLPALMWVADAKHEVIKNETH